MSKFKEKVNSPKGSKFILQGNEAFALGVVHAGYHTVDGYPGTPSTEVIDKSLKYVQDKIQVGWSVNEVVATAVAIGHSIAGHDSVVTMKIPGVFQAGDAISTSAFYTATAGALVIFAATDYVPSSTQHVIDSRHFFASARIPVLEPRNHQEMYEIAWYAADISRKFNTPVVVLASGILTHSEGLVVTKEPRTITPLPIPEKMNQWMTMPGIARANYNKATQIRIPEIEKWAEESNIINESQGTASWGIIVCGEPDIIVREALNKLNLNPSILSMAISYPFPKERIKSFAKKIKNQIFVFEDGDKFLQDKIRLMGVNVIGKDELSTITDYTPEIIIKFLSEQLNIKITQTKKETNQVKPLPRPPSICPGCPYRAFGLSVAKLKKKKKIHASFGDIGCSTLLHFMNALDTVLCMGASDSMRQGFVLSHPEMANKTISIIGDSCECHSGMDSTRNAVFRNVPGVKVILDNRITAMTGGQPAPSTPYNLAGEQHNFNLKRAIEAEGCRTIVENAYDLKQVEKVLTESLELATQGKFTTLILEGACVHEVERKSTIRTIEFDYEKCINCGLCNMCPGIILDDNRVPSFTNLCTNCGSSEQVCMQKCPHEAIVPIQNKNKTKIPNLPKVEKFSIPKIDKTLLPESLRVAIRGIGGQGNLFFGKVLSELALLTPYSETHIVKGDTHGMAQLGGSVISTFSCGNVFSPILAPDTVDVLVVMEISEVLRPGFLDLLKPNGTIIFNNFKAIPPTSKKEDYPKLEEIEALLTEYKVIKIDANKIAYDLGDKAGRTANVVVIGLLSTIAPFEQIPESVWLSAIMSVSPNDLIKSANKLAFESGRKC